MLLAMAALEFQIVDERLEYNADLGRACIRFYGRRSDGSSVALDVYGLSSYFYTNAWSAERTRLMNHEIEGACRYAKRCSCVGCARGPKVRDQIPCVEYKNGCSEFITSVEEVTRTEFVGYRPGPGNFVKVSVAHPFLLRNIMYKKEPWEQFFEIDVDPVVRFNVDHGIKPCGWLRVPEAKTATGHGLRCELLVIDMDAGGTFEVLERNDMAPWRVTCFDIECVSAEDRFPTALLDDPVNQVAMVDYIYGTEEVLKTIYVLDTCDPIEGVAVVSCETERELLLAVRQHILDFDSDVLSGYNSASFDLPYLYDRAKRLKIPQFMDFSKEEEFPVIHKVSSFTSAQAGTRETHAHIIPGRVELDLLPRCRETLRLRSYKLDDVAFEVLKQNKDKGVSYDQLYSLQMGSSAERCKIAVYCVMDTILCVNLLKKLKFLENTVAMANLCGITMQSVLSRGQSFKCTAFILQYTKRFGYICETFKKQSVVNEKGEEMSFTHVPFYDGIENKALGGAAGSKAVFKGATVIEPERGFYTKPVAVLDFASLYPSVMIFHNLSHDTLLRSRKEARKMGLTPEDIEETPNGYLFVKKAKKQGVLPLIEEELWAARNAYKKKMKAAEDELTRSVYDGMQGAIKVLMNSLYGFCGAKTASLPCVYISASVTSFGRQKLEEAAAFASERFGAHLVYGDTDSIFVTLPTDSNAEAFAISERIEEAINGPDGIFNKPVYVSNQSRALNSQHCP